VDAFTRAINSGKSERVGSKTLRDQAIEIAGEYFSSYRRDADQLDVDPSVLDFTDKAWQDLVRLAHGRNRRTSYIRSLETIRRGLLQLSVAILTNRAEYSSEWRPTADERIILETLEKIVPTAALSYRQGCMDLNSADDRISFRGTSTEFREALREVLDKLAPDSELLTDPDFRLDKERTKPTMKQKVRYILRSRGMRRTAIKPATDSIDAIVEMVGAVTRSVYDRASLSTHVMTSSEEVSRIKRYIDNVLFELLEIG
jgi:hypothetical protein